MKLRTKIMAWVLLYTLCLTAQNVPTYLDGSKSVEQRVQDALSRMTVAEKIAIIHAQSKFSA
ncbi:MAG: hypothetical protein PUD26_04945, partial [bacterium]|nr:hypothetical protein [bacterium]